MNDRTALIFSGCIIAVFFVAGLLGILENFMVTMILVIVFVAFVIYLVKETIDNHKKNLPK